MKYYKENNEVFAYEEDGSQDHLIGDKALMTAEEVELHLNPPKTEEQTEAEWKASRAEAVANIKVTVNDKVYDGDETSQTRIARAISVMNDTETIAWVLADDSVHMATKAELSEALKLAGAEQTSLWVRR